MPFKRERKTRRDESCNGANPAPESGCEIELGKLCAVALSEVEATLASLPEPLRVRAEKLPVIFERQPTRNCRRMESSRTRLVVHGREFAEENDVPMPPQIILFLENIWDVAETNEKRFCEEVRTTFCTSWVIIWVWTRMN